MMRAGRAVCRAGFVVSAALAVACTDRLPEQDLRILAATPVARLSADLLWDDYQKNRDQADAAYHGKAIVITGTATGVGADEPGKREVIFAKAGSGGGIRAKLLDEQATAILARAKENPRLSLKCFCEGLNDLVILKSCVAP